MELASLMKGDRVTLKKHLGQLTPEDIGIVVEVYGEDENLFEESSEQPYLEDNRGLFRYAVTFPVLRTLMPKDASAWLPPTLDLSQFHSGDVVPCMEDELVFVDSVMRGMIK